MGIIQRDSLRVSIISYAGAAIGYLNKIFLFTNFLESEEVGLVNLMVTVSLIYAQLSALGGRNIILRFFPFFSDLRKNQHGFLTGVMAIILGGFTVITILFVLVRRPLAGLYVDSSPLLVEYAVYIVPMALATLFYNIFESYLRCLYRNILPTVAHELILRLSVTIAVSLYALGVIGFGAFVSLYVGAYCVPATLLIIYSVSRGLAGFTFYIPPLFRRLGRIMIVYGLFLLMNNLSGFLLVSLDSLMVAGMLDLGAAGVYTTMVFLTSVMLIPYRSMVKVAAPMVASIWKSKDMDKMQDIYAKATSGNLVVGASIFMLLWVNLDSVYYFMPAGYQEGRYVFLLLGAGKLFDMSSGLNSTILTTSRKYRFDLLFTIAMAGLVFITNLQFIPLWGIEGAAFSSMLCLVLFNFLRVIFIRYHFNIQPFRGVHLVVILLMAAIMFVSGLTAKLPVVYADILLRSVTALVLFIVPVWLIRVSPELNAWAGGIISRFGR